MPVHCLLLKDVRIQMSWRGDLVDPLVDSFGFLNFNQFIEHAEIRGY